MIDTRINDSLIFLGAVMLSIFCVTCFNWEDAKFPTLATKDSKTETNVLRLSKQDIGDALEHLEEVVIPEDLKAYAGITVVECDATESFFPKSYMMFDDGTYIVHLIGNVKCTSDDNAYLIPAEIGISCEEDGTPFHQEWVMTSGIVKKH